MLAFPHFRISWMIYHQSQIFLIPYPTLIAAVIGNATVLSVVTVVAPTSPVSAVVVATPVTPAVYMAPAPVLVIKLDTVLDPMVCATRLEAVDCTVGVPSLCPTALRIGRVRAPDTMLRAALSEAG